MMRVTLGVGCDRGTSLQTLDTAVDDALKMVGVARTAVTTLATIDKKSDEAGLLALAHAQGWSMTFYTAEELARVAVPNPSEMVRKHMGTPAVAEAAALLAARAGINDLLVEKYKYRGADGKNATVSIARIAE